jgi:hypothetical protein
VNSRVPEPCDTPDDGHDGQVRFYATGWKCDAHSPWAAKGLPAPAPGPGPIYTYRPTTNTQERPAEAKTAGHQPQGEHTP